MTDKTTKALKALELALSAERIGSFSECVAAARVAGSLTRKAGFGLEKLRASVNQSQSPITWSNVSNGWYDQGEEHEVTTVTTQDQTKFWAERVAIWSETFATCWANFDFAGAANARKMANTARAELQRLQATSK